MMSFSKMLILGAALLVPGVAFAEGGLVRTACQNDIKSLCGSVQPGGGRIRDCMRQHRTELSATCKMAIADRMLERGAQRSAAGATGAGITQVPK